MSQISNIPNSAATISAYRQAGVNNNYSNIVPLSYNLFDGFSNPLDGGCGCRIPGCNGGCGIGINGGCGIGINGGVGGCGCRTPGCNGGCNGGGNNGVQPTPCLLGGGGVGVTADILQTVRPGVANKNRKRVAPRRGVVVGGAGANSGEVNIYTDGNSEREDLDILSRQQGDNECNRKVRRMRQLPRLVESEPGLFSGEYVNEILLPQQQRISIDTFGNIFGQPTSAIIEQRLDRLNGFGEAVGINNYGNPCEPGSFNRPFVKDNFLMGFGVGNQSIWGNRIVQFATPPNGYTGPTGPFGVIDLETQGLGITFNAQAPGSIMYLQRRKRPYYFHFPLQNNCSNLPCGVSACTLDRYGGAYFTTDPIGGSYYNYINQIGQTSPIIPPVFPGTQVMTPGCTTWVCVDQTWPDTLFLQCTLGPFMGCTVIVVGCCSD